MSAILKVTLLATNHDRKGFACGVPELDRYLQKQARQDLKRKLAVPYVLANDEGRIAGFYTLSSFSIEIGELPEKIANKLPYPKIPAVLIGRLAVDRSFQGQGVGERLLMDALSRSAEQGRTLGLWAIVVQAKNQSAADFYMKYDFMPLPGSRRHLFLPMKTIAALFQ